MNDSKTSKGVTNPLRKASLVMRIGVAFVIIVVLVLAALHFSGTIPIHRLPRILTAPLRSPERADVDNVFEYERANFTFSYPGNWRLDTLNEHHHPDSFLTLDAPSRGRIVLQILAGDMDVDSDSKYAAEQVASLFESQGLLITNRTEFRTWGQLHGDGLILSGRKLGEPFQFRIFVHFGNTQSLVIREYWWDGPDSINATGFKLIEDSFQFSTSSDEAME